MIKSFNKFFESNSDESDDIELGFKYSDNFIKDRLYYLTDIGFELTSFRNYYLDPNGEYAEGVGKSLHKYKGAKWAVNSFILRKDLPKGTSRRYFRNDGGMPVHHLSKYHHISYDLSSEIMEEISSISLHFDNNCYHCILYESDRIEVSFLIYNEIPDGLIEAEIENRRVYAD